jgi:TPR repeat protein
MGIYVEKDLEVATEYYKKALDLGHKRALACLGDGYAKRRKLH